MYWLYSEVADPGDVVTQKQRVAIFDTHAPAFATPLPMLHAHRNQIFRGEQRRGARRLSLGLHRTSQQSVQAIVEKMYVHRPPFIDLVPVPCFSKTAGYAGCSRRSWLNLFETFLVTSVIQSESPLAYHGDLIDEDSVLSVGATSGEKCLR